MTTPGMRLFNVSWGMTEPSRLMSADDRPVTPRGILAIGNSLPGSGETLTLSEGPGTAKTGACGAGAVSATGCGAGVFLGFGAVAAF